MAEPKIVVAPEAAVTQPSPAPAPSEKTPPKTVVKFWKKMNPFEKILFKDGTSLVFGQTIYVTADETVIKNLLSVADRYGILKQ